jgi:hypothetical protein
MIEVAIVKKIKEDAAIKAKLNDKIYALIAPATTTGTYMTYYLLSGGQEEDQSKLKRELFRFSIFADTLTAAREIKNLFCTLFDNKSEKIGDSYIVRSKIVNRGIELQDPESKKFQIVMETEFKYF